MREARVAKQAAEKERQERAKVARTERAAAAAAARAVAKAEAEGEAAQAVEAEAAKANAAKQGTGPTNEDTKAQGLNGYAQQPWQAQHAQLAHKARQSFDSASASTDKRQQHAAMAAMSNGFHLPQSSSVGHQAISPGAHAGHAQSPTAGSDPEVDIMNSTPEKATAVTAAADGGSAEASPEIDIIHSISPDRLRHYHPPQRHPNLDPSCMLDTALQDTESGIAQMSPFVQRESQPGPQQLKAEDETHSMGAFEASFGAQHLDGDAMVDKMEHGQGPAQEQRRSASASEPDFDWAAWQSPEDAPRGGAVILHLFQHSVMP